MQKIKEATHKLKTRDKLRTRNKGKKLNQTQEKGLIGEAALIRLA
jgi:hypothetical protein